MIEELKPVITGVVCLHCGMYTPVPKSASRGLAKDFFAASGPQISIVRCTACGKEAPYLADEIVVLKGLPSTAFYAA